MMGLYGMIGFGALFVGLCCLRVADSVDALRRTLVALEAEASRPTQLSRQQMIDRINREVVEKVAGRK